jgi:hypothetical protein
MAEERQQSQKDRAQPPTAPSGRRGGNDPARPGESTQPDRPTPRRYPVDDDEDSPLGTRNTFR